MRNAVFCALALSCAAISMPAVAGEAPVAETRASASLPANTEVVLALSAALSSAQSRVGDTFPLTVVRDVKVNGEVAIPRGARAVGEVVWRTGKGGFGKSGKLEIAVRHIEVGGQRLPVTGKFRQDGKGNTVGTVAGVALAGLVGGFLITGKSGVIPQGQEIIVRTTSAFAYVANVKSVPAKMALATRPSLAAVAKRPPLTLKSGVIEEDGDDDDSDADDVDDNKPPVTPGFSLESADADFGSDDGVSSDDAEPVRSAASRSGRYLSRGKDGTTALTTKLKKKPVYTVIKEPVSIVLR